MRVQSHLICLHIAGPANVSIQLILKSASEASGAFNRHTDAQLGAKRLRRVGSWFITSSLNKAFCTKKQEC